MSSLSRHSKVRKFHLTDAPDYGEAPKPRGRYEPSARDVLSLRVQEAMDWETSMNNEPISETEQKEFLACLPLDLVQTWKEAVEQQQLPQLAMPAPQQERKEEIQAQAPDILPMVLVEPEKAVNIPERRAISPLVLDPEKPLAMEVESKTPAPSTSLALTNTLPASSGPSPLLTAVFKNDLVGAAYNENGQRRTLKASRKGMQHKQPNIPDVELAETENTEDVSSTTGEIGEDEQEEKDDEAKNIAETSILTDLDDQQLLAALNQVEVKQQQQSSQQSIPHPVPPPSVQPQAAQQPAFTLPSQASFSSGQAIDKPKAPPVPTAPLPPVSGTKRKRPDDLASNPTLVKLRLVTPFNFNDKVPKDKFVPIIPPELYRVSPAVTRAFRATLPKWRKLDQMPDRIKGRQLTMWVKEITSFRGSMWLDGITKQDESVIIEILARPVFLIEWPQDGRELSEKDFAALTKELNSLSNNRKIQVARCSKALRYPVAGWTGEQKIPYILVEFPDAGSHRYYKELLMPYKPKPGQDDLHGDEKRQRHVSVPWADRPIPLKLFNEEIPVECQIMAMADGGNLTPASWITIPGNAWTWSYTHVQQRKTRYRTYELQLPYDKIPLIKTVVGDFSVGTFRWGSLDIECVSARGAKHKPFALNKGDVITMITVLCYMARDGLKAPPFATYTFALGVTHSSEKEMLDDYLLLRAQIDGGISWNGVAFDDPYTLVRAHLLESDFRDVSIFKGHRVCGAHQIERLNKDPKNGFNRCYIPGFIHLDALVPTKKDSKLQSKKLGNVVKVYLIPTNEEEKELYKKIDLPYEQLYECLVNPLRREEAVKYNIRDCRLPPYIAAAKKYDLAVWETLRLVRINAWDYIARGQQIKVWYKLCIFLLTGDWALNKEDVAAISLLFSCPYIGGFVVDPKRGVQKWVWTFDFSSLYPSLILSKWLCYTTIIANPKYLEIAEKMGRKVEWINLTDDVRVPVVQNLPMTMCLLPRIVDDLLKERKRVKVLMEAANDQKLEAKAKHDEIGYIKADGEYTVYNARQLEVKVIANSVYGFTGVADENEASEKKRKVATKPYIACKVIAKLICKCGRNAAHAVIDLAVKKYRARIIYGDTDSVMPQFPEQLEEQKQKLQFKGLKEDSKEFDKELRDWACEHGEQFGKEASAMFNKPMKLEHENTSITMVPINKKMYIKKYFVPEIKERYDTKFMIKGLYTGRRDWCDESRDLGKLCFKMIVFDERPLSEVREQIFKVARGLRDGTTPLEKLLMNKKLGDLESYANVDAQAHTYLAKKMQGLPDAPQTGDNVAWLQCKMGYPEQSRNVATLEEVKRDKLEVDSNYYWSVQIAPPLENVLEKIDMVWIRDTLAQADAYRKRLRSLTEFYQLQQKGDGNQRPQKRARIVDKKALTGKEKKEKAAANTKPLTKFFQ